MARKPPPKKKPAAPAPKPAPMTEIQVLGPAEIRVGGESLGFVRNIDIQVGPVERPPGSLLKKPKAPK